ncbi:MAG: cytochrome c-type biogenesis protein CcmH [Acidimicrobiia bacterium]
MSPMRRSLGIGLILGLLAVIVIALLPGDEPKTTEQRVHDIASGIRCPSCNGASIADAQSSVARDLEIVIREQVDAGLSDQDIYDYFVARYSEAALLSPPTRGWGLWLWLLPLAALVVGSGVVLGRRRTRATSPPRPGAALVEHLEAVEGDLGDLDAQVTAGDLDTATADSLRSVYEEERIAITGLLDADAVAASPASRGRRRVLAGAAFVGAGMLAVGLSVGVAVRDRAPRGPLTGDIVQSAATEGLIDLGTVTNDQLEDVVARAPDNMPMRRALARRYFFDGAFDRAFDHYMVVLDAGPDPEALANVGWITYVGSDEVEIAHSFVERSLAIEPENPMAYWFLANIRLGGLDDPHSAVAPLQRFLEYPDVPDELRAEAETLLAAALAAGS